MENVASYFKQEDHLSFIQNHVAEVGSLTTA